MTPIWPTTTALGWVERLFAAVKKVGERTAEKKPPMEKPMSVQIYAAVFE